MSDERPILGGRRPLDQGAEIGRLRIMMTNLRTLVDCLRGENHLALRMTAEGNATIAALRADLAAKSDALTIISKHDLVDFENPIEPGDAYRVLNNAILLARAALKEPPHAE